MVPSPTTTALKRITAATASTGVAAERIDIHIMTGKVRVSPLLRNSAMGSAGVRAAERRRRVRTRAAMRSSGSARRVQRPGLNHRSQKLASA
jgi:hypothetical protein